MSPTFVTSTIMITFAVGLIAGTIRIWLGSWDTFGHRRDLEHYDPHVESAVREMRREIDDYERRNGMP